MPCYQHSVIPPPRRACAVPANAAQGTCWRRSIRLEQVHGKWKTIHLKDIWTMGAGTVHSPPISLLRWLAAATGTASPIPSSFTSCVPITQIGSAPGSIPRRPKTSPFRCPSLLSVPMAAQASDAGLPALEGEGGALLAAVIDNPAGEVGLAVLEEGGCSLLLAQHVETTRTFAHTL